MKCCSFGKNCLKYKRRTGLRITFENSEPENFLDDVEEVSYEYLTIERDKIKVIKLWWSDEISKVDSAVEVIKEYMDIHEEAFWFRMGYYIYSRNWKKCRSFNSNGFTQNFGILI